MVMMRLSMPFFLLLLAGFSSAIQIELYYGEGCPHCASTYSLLQSIQGSHNLSIATHEVYYDENERTKLIATYEKFSYDINKGGVPTIIVDGKTMIIGEMGESQWHSLFNACLEGRCPEGVFTHSTLTLPSGNQTSMANTTTTDPIEERNGMGSLALSVLIGAALVDSINPCTIAVMVLLCGAILCSKGRTDALVAGMIFSIVIFFMYMLYGLGIMKAIAAFELTRIFYIIVTAGALMLALMELNAYFNYKPGFLAVEMPMFLRPYAKKATASATSPAGVALAAVLCSLFLLPCSSGPYLLVLGMLAKAATLQTIGYLVLYNIFFILPMIMITIAIYLGKTSVEKVDAMKEKYIKAIHLFSGLILLVLFLMMLGQATGWY